MASLKFNVFLQSREKQKFVPLFLFYNVLCFGINIVPLRQKTERPVAMHIAIAGNIGSGKTTLTNMLARHFGWTPRFEAVTHNPYLEDYYADIHRWAFNLEVFFLTQRFKDALAIRRSAETIIQDRSIFEGVYIFAANNYAMGHLTERDFQTYMDLFHLMTSLVGTPDLMIYLRCSVPHLVTQIQKRGRNYEQTMQIDYLKNLNDSYEDFIFHKYPGRVLVIDKDNLDYEHRPQDFALIVDKINADLYGLFPMDGMAGRTNNP